MDEHSSTESVNINIRTIVNNKHIENPLTTSSHANSYTQIDNKGGDPNKKTYSTIPSEYYMGRIFVRNSESSKYVNKSTNNHRNQDQELNQSILSTKINDENYYDEGNSPDSSKSVLKNTENIEDPFAAPYNDESFDAVMHDRYPDYINMVCQKFGGFYTNKLRDYSNDNRIISSEMPSPIPHYYPINFLDGNYRKSSPSETKRMEAVLGVLKLKRIFKDRTYFEQGYKYKSDLQIRVLNEVLEITSYPGAQARDTLAILLNLNPRSIQIWFQNARQSNERKISKDEVRSRKINNHIDVLKLVEIYQKNYNIH